jgi:hypothetical protein
MLLLTTAFFPPLLTNSSGKLGIVYIYLLGIHFLINTKSKINNILFIYGLYGYDIVAVILVCLFYSRYLFILSLVEEDYYSHNLCNFHIVSKNLLSLVEDLSLL